jgi:hypothetical protein
VKTTLAIESWKGTKSTNTTTVMKHIKLFAILGIALALAGCVVTSVYPYYTEKDVIFDPALARIFHSGIEQRSGEGVRRLDITQPNENAHHRFFWDRL